MDEADYAEKLEEQFRQAAISKVRTERQLMPIGICHYCGDPVRPGELFCTLGGSIDDSCVKDYERAAAAAKRNGSA